VHGLPEEIDGLVRIVGLGTDALAIAAACPERTWAAIQNKLCAVIGLGRVGRKYHIIKANETIGQHSARIGQKEGGIGQAGISQIERGAEFRAVIQAHIGGDDQIARGEGLLLAARLGRKS
jgi:hypothetical protein